MRDTLLSPFYLCINNVFLYFLSCLGVKVHKGDLCNERLVRYLFETVKFDSVIHMAAQAGVAYSVVDPISYVTANIECLVNMLDILADYKVHVCI